MRNFPDWLQAYVDYASFSEAPRKMHFFCGVSAIAGALRRRVWVDQRYFRWYPNAYVILVAPPGVVSKSTTASIAMNMLRKVPGIKFGPDVVTWPALVSAFASATEQFEYPVGAHEYHAQSALTIESSEFGNLVDPTDRSLMDLLVSLWDSKMGAFTKITKGSGNDTVENPFINIVACTTPAWIAGNFPEYVIGGGFTSRCLFVYAEKKEKLVAYPYLHVPADLAEKEAKLVQDLEHIANALVGPYTLTQDAIEWGDEWYEHLHAHPPTGLSDDRFGGYLARKQTHLHKLAMVLAAATRDEMVINADDLSLSNTMLATIEEDMPKVFSKIGRSEESVQVERLLQYIRKHPEGLTYAEAYQYIHAHFPDAKRFENVVSGAVRANLVTMQSYPGGILLKPVLNVRKESPPLSTDKKE